MRDGNENKNFTKNSERRVETSDIKSNRSAGEKVENFFVKNKKRNLKITVVIVAVILAVVLIAGGAFVASKLGLINFSDGFHGNDETFASEEQFEAMYDVSDASDIDSLITKWAKNGGEKFSSKNVINVLLLGIGNYGGDATGLSDSIMLVSLNKKTKTIKLVSFLRDSYTYINVNGEDRCCKMNHAHSWGGPATLIETLENNYKIEIDHYVSVDFQTFPKLIDALGGVTIPIEPYEASYINRTTTKIAKIQSGDAVTLNGDQALVYCRIRKIDSAGDIGRTARQRKIIMALINSAKGASVGQLNNALNIVLPHVVTNYKQSEIISLLTQAISQGWMNYSIKQLVMPSEGNYTSAQLWTYYSRIINMPLSVWVIDYPMVARDLQLALYGDTNIKIGDDHVSAVDLIASSGTLRPNYNNSYETEATQDATDVTDITDSTDWSEGESESDTNVFPDIGDITFPDFTLPDITLPWQTEADTQGETEPDTVEPLTEQANDELY